MNSKLSENEMEILGRQVAGLSNQMSQIAESLETRLGETNEVAALARNAEREFTRFAQRVRRHMASAGDEAGPKGRSQTA
ncbi:MAG TPA: hypothetical protein VEV17_22535 [Bryobacteraceae bacterium]|nr:hypothetical protein [Bryobacteraceae bacterium]